MTDIALKQESNIQQFNPEQTLNKQAQAEAGISFGEKTGNFEMVEQAVEALCDERFHFLQWWDANKEKGGRGKTIRRTANSLPDKDSRSRWRKEHGTPELNERTKEKKVEKSRRVIDGTNSVQGNKSIQDQWYTPEQYIKSAKIVMGDIDLDPASCEAAQKTVMAADYYSEDALNKHWAGRIWMNPPFSDVLGFAEKLISHLESGDVTQAIVLTNNNTDTLWLHKLAEIASQICFTRGRISFYNEAGEAKGNTNGQTFFYFGENAQEFIDEFYAHGLVLK